MSTRMAADISIGGKIAATLMPELCRAICEQGVALEWGAAPFQPSDARELLTERQELEPGGAMVLRLYDEQAHWGEFDELEAFLQEHDIPYTRRTDGDCQYDPAVIEFRPGAAPLLLAANKDGEPVVAVSLLGELVDRLNSTASADSHAAMF